MTNAFAGMKESKGWVERGIANEALRTKFQNIFSAALKESNPDANICDASLEMGTDQFIKMFNIPLDQKERHIVMNPESTSLMRVSGFVEDEKDLLLMAKRWGQMFPFHTIPSKYADHIFFIPMHAVAMKRPNFDEEVNISLRYTMVDRDKDIELVEGEEDGE